VLATLARHGVDFVLIGGAAANLHGGVQLTDDTDVIYRYDKDNLQRLASALDELGAEAMHHPGLKTDDLAALLSGSDLWRWRTKHGVLDMMTWASGAPHKYDDLARRADTYDIDGQAVKVAAIDDLIAMKKTTDRPTDKLKLVELEELSQVRRQLESNAQPDD
jgi:predicted nucleotidyltransferase